MRNVGVVVAQIVVALLLTGVITPAVLVAVPSLAQRGTGMAVIFAGAVGIFLLLRLVWPGRKT